MKKLALFLGMISCLIHVNAQEIFQTEKLPEVVKVGEGETTLILIPCMGCRWNSWQEFMDRNQDRYTMYAITVPGYGGTPPPNLPKNTIGTPWRDHLMEGLSELVDQDELKEIVLVGHSWGSMVAVQFASIRKEVVAKVISVDGSIESTSWTPDSFEERQRSAKQIYDDYSVTFQSAEEWSRFNGASVGYALGNTDSVTKETMNYRIKLLTSFVATDKESLLQYWRENVLIDLSAHLRKIAVPILDIQAFSGKDQNQLRKQYEESLQQAQAPNNVQSVFMYDTKHHIMYHRPLELDCLIFDFLNGKPLTDFAPDSSEYFEEEQLN